MSERPRHFYEFGPFRLDAAERVLFRGEAPVTLHPKAVDTLLLLVRDSGHVLDKDELLKALWPDTFVEEHNLVQQIFLLRKVLGESTDGQPYIETIPKRGYRFTAPVRESWEAEEEEQQGISLGLAHRRLVAWLLGAACVLAAGVTGWLLFLRPGTGAPEAVLRAVPATSYPGNETFPDFSPDGSQIAFARRRQDSDNHDIYVKVVGSGEPLQLTSGPEEDVAPAWSPDGRHIAFYRRSEDGGGIYTVSTLGGSERLFAQLRAEPPNSWHTGYADAQLSWSPDGELLAFQDQNSPREPYIIWLLSVATGERRMLTSPPAEWLGDGSPAFSPDGQALAFARVQAYEREDIYLVPAGGGEPRRLTFDNRRIEGLAWTVDGREIVFASWRTGQANLWRVSKSGGDPRLVPGIGGGIYLPALSRQGRRLVFARSAHDINIWRVEAPAPGGAPKPATKLVESTRGELEPQFSPDGQRVAFTSNRSGTMQVWVCDSDGSNLVQLTSFGEPGAELSYWSPDGRHIAFNSRLKGSWNVYVINSQGGVPRQLTAENSVDAGPVSGWSRDGRWVYFGSNRTGAYEVWKVPVEGGTPVQVTKNGGCRALESPDGKFIYYTKGRTVYDVWKLPVGGGEEVPVLENLEGRWAVAEKGLYLIERAKDAAAGGKWFIQFFDFATRQVTPIVPLEKESNREPPAISPDGRTFLYTQIDTGEGDLMLVENFR